MSHLPLIIEDKNNKIYWKKRRNPAIVKFKRFKECEKATEAYFEYILIKNIVCSNEDFIKNPNYPFSSLKKEE